MASVLHPDSLASLPLIQRVQAFFTMVEGKAMHNAQVADLDTKATGVYVNKGIKAISGLISTSPLRCDLGVLPCRAGRTPQRHVLLMAPQEASMVPPLPPTPGLPSTNCQTHLHGPTIPRPPNARRRRHGTRPVKSRCEEGNP